MKNGTPTLPVILIIAGLCLGAGTSRGDVIQLHGGQRITGIVVAETPSNISLETSGGVMSIARDRIASLQIEDEAHNLLYRASFQMRRSDTPTAYGMLEDARGSGVGDSRLRRWMLDHLHHLSRIGQDDPAVPLRAWRPLLRELAALETQPLPEPRPSSPITTLTLTRLPTARPGSAVEVDYLLGMARLFEKLGDRAEAAAYTGQLTATQIASLAPVEPLLQPLLVETIRQRLDADDFEGATEILSRMQLAGMSGSEAAKILILLRWSSGLRDAGNLEGALRVLSDELKPMSPILARDRIAATLNLAHQQSIERGRFEQMEALYENHGGDLPAEHLSEARAALAREWAQWLLDSDDPNGARTQYERFMEMNPSADPTFLNRCEYHRRRLALEPEDRAGAFELAQWAARNDLDAEAIEAYERASAHPDLKPMANEQIAILQERAVIAHLNQCVRWLEAGDPRRALDELQNFPYQTAARKIAPEVIELRRLCLTEIARRQELDSVQAETLFQEAQRRFFLGDTEAARRDLEQILTYYRGTEAAPKARDLLRIVRTRVSVEELEGSRTTTPKPHLRPSTDDRLEHEVQQILDNLDIPSSSPAAN